MARGKSSEQRSMLAFLVYTTARRVQRSTISEDLPQTDEFQTSQRIRKRTEEIFGWMKTTGGLRRTRYRGTARTQMSAYFVGATYNLVRMSRLVAA